MPDWLPRTLIWLGYFGIIAGVMWPREDYRIRDAIMGAFAVVLGLGLRMALG